MAMIDEVQIYKWWSIFRKGDELVEVRIIAPNGKNFSGYYKNIENLIRDVERFSNDPNCNIYFTLNCVNDDCYSRSQNENMIITKTTTSDSDIIGRKFVLVDLDPKRATGVSATDEELELAHLKAVDIYRYLIDNGFYEPIVALSGNGFHVLIPCKIAANSENDNMIRRFLFALSMLFTDEHIEVDKKVYNLARICKLYGTKAQKGADTEKRPHRMSQILKIPDEIKENDIAYFKKIADLYPEDVVENNRYNKFGKDDFNLDDFIQKHGIQVTKIEHIDGGKKYVLDHCLFDEQHKGKDAVIFQRDNGAISYVCLHNSCSQYKWRDVRLMFEPDAYDRKDYAEFKHKQQYYGNYKREPFVPQKENETIGKKWLSMSDIQYVDISKLISIPTGYEMLDKKIVGLMLGDISVLSGTSGSGKTSWIDCMTLNVISRGFNVAIWSGELQDFRFQGWINQIAAGKSFVRKKEGYDNFYYTPKNISEKINLWLDKKLFLYNNQYGNKWQQLFSDIKDVVEKENVQLVVLDNLMALNIDGYDGDKYSQQTRFINDLKEYAKIKNVHILLVCHPRKEMGFLRKESISGTADLTNLADNVFIIHRVGKDFETRGTEFFGEDKIREYSVYSSVIEVAKNRSVGIVDLLVGMYYELETRRLKNTIDEHIIYGWQEEPKQQSLMDMDEQDFLSPRENMECPF